MAHPDSPASLPSAKNVAEDHWDKPTSSVKVWIGVVASLAVISIITYYFLKHIFSYMGARAYIVSMTCLNDKQMIRAGETIAIKLTFTKLLDDAQEVLVTPKELDLIDSQLVLNFHPKPKSDLVKSRINLSPFQQEEEAVGVMRSFTPNKDALIIRFSLRQSKLHKLFCRYWWYNFVHSPLEFEVLPAPIAINNTVMEVQNPESIPVLVDQWVLIPVKTHDRYGNVCQIEETMVGKFGIIVKMQNDEFAESPQLDWEFALQGTDFFLQLKTKKARIYKCMMTFMGKPIEQSVYSQSFMVISMNLSEEHLFRTGFESYFSYGSTPAKLLFVGSEGQREPSDICITVNKKTVSISAAMLNGVLFYPFLAFYINRRTRISLIGPHDLRNNGGNEYSESEVSLKISDGIQDSVTFALGAGAARILMATFGHAKGHKLKRTSFLEKKTALASEIGPGFINRIFNQSFFMGVDDKDLLASSIASAPTRSGDWWRKFTIGVIKPSPSSSSENSSSGIIASMMPRFGQPPHKPMPMESWLENIMEILFLAKDDYGLFVKNGGSSRLHPNLATRRKSRWTDKQMEFAGTLVGKYISDAINHGICVNFTYLRFTKSFLACLIGVPVTYQQFQSDYPSFYEKHVKKVLNTTLDKMSLKFETPKGFEANMDKGTSNSAENIAIIPDGNNIDVTEKNKIHYLNLLALHILKNRHDPEIQAFRDGFFKILPQGLVADFDIDELEILICGGVASSFTIKDLRKNHRVVGDLLNSAGLSDTDLPRYNFSKEDQGKILRWFWIAISNLTPEERMTLLTLVTGSNALPTCGFKDLSPKFTISLTGGYNQQPKYHPALHQMAIGNHSTFERFEKNIIESLHDPEEMRLILLEEDDTETGRVSLEDRERSADIEFQNETETGIEPESRYLKYCAIV